VFPPPPHPSLPAPIFIRIVSGNSIQLEPSLLSSFFFLSILPARTPEVESSFKTREMQVLVFDDAGGDDPSRSIIGVAFVPLAELSRGAPVEGAFRLINPLSRQEVGQVVLGMGWHNPLRLPGEMPVSGACVREREKEREDG
jgi:hypothetical protein